MNLTFHFLTEPTPDDAQHKAHLIKEFLRSKGVATEDNGGHAWIEIHE